MYMYTYMYYKYTCTYCTCAIRSAYHCNTWPVLLNIFIGWNSYTYRSSLNLWLRYDFSNDRDMTVQTFSLVQIWMIGSSSSPPPPPPPPKGLNTGILLLFLYIFFAYLIPYKWNQQSALIIICTPTLLVMLVHWVNVWYLKPQDSFGGFDRKKILDLQKVHQTIRKHH